MYLDRFCCHISEVSLNDTAAHFMIFLLLLFRIDGVFQLTLENHVSFYASVLRATRRKLFRFDFISKFIYLTNDWENYKNYF